MNLILFDLDGTLYSSREILPTAYQQGIKVFNESQDRHEVDVPTEEQIFNQVGKPVDEIYANLFPGVDEDLRSDLQRSIFSTLLEKIQNRQGRLYEGVKDVLNRLNSKRKLCMITNAQQAYMEAVVDAHSLEPFFMAQLCNDDAPNGKKSQNVDALLNQFGASPSDTLLVGDRASDRKAAEKHDVQFVGCEYGYGRKELFSDTNSIERFTELLDTIPTP